MTVLTSGAAVNLREQILSAAASCFRERGIKATKMQEIAKRAGISVGNFYNYFENKDQYAPLTVSNLANLRAYSPELAYNPEVFNIITNSMGFESF